MLDDPYTTLAQALNSHDILCRFQTPGQMVVSVQAGPTWPDRGNSFWVTHATGKWHLFTWAPFGYLLPNSDRIVDLCREFMASSNRAAFVVPPELVSAFELVELADAETETVYRAMETGNEPA